jgi:selenocysteine-specific elongation factor
MLDCSLNYLASAPKPLKHRARVRVHLGTAELIGRVSLLDREELQPGDGAPIQLLLESEAAVWPADRYVIRSYSPGATIGGGVVLGNVSPRKRKRLTDKDQSYNTDVFNTLMHGTAEEKCLLLLKESGMAGLTAKDLGIRLGLFGKHLDKILQIPLSTKKMVVVDSAGQRYVDQAIAEEVVKGIVSFLESYHLSNPLKNGLSKEEVRSGFQQFVDPKVFNYCLNDLLRKKTVVQEESIIRMAGHEVALKADEQQLQRDLVKWYRDQGLTAPTIKETFSRFSEYPEGLVKEVLALLLKEGELVKISESLYFSAGPLTTLQEDVVAFIKKEGEIDAPRFKTLSGLTRKFSIPILEYFDRIKLTIRVGDCRKLRGQG